MPRRTNLFFDPKLNEWLFHKLVNLTADDKKNLNHYELRILRSNTAIKQFVCNGDIKRIMTVLPKVGIRFNLTFFSSDAPITLKMLKDTYKQYSIKGLAVDNVDQMIRENVFVLNSRDIAMSLALMSINCHSEIYVLNPGFTSFKTTIQAIGSKNKKRELALRNANIEHQEVSRETKNLTKLVMATLRLESYITGVLNLQTLDMMILWLLYLTPYNFVKLDYIQRELLSVYKPKSVGYRSAYLFRERGLLDKRPSAERVVSYIITAEGILTVGKINNHIVNTVYTD